jgi:DNA-binding NarL/FixJ family response regulator
VQLPTARAEADISPGCPRGGNCPATKRLLDRTRKLTRRQRRVVALVTRGLKNREITTKLGIGAHVARNYVSAIYDQMGVSNRVELALWYEARIHEAGYSCDFEIPPGNCARN